MSRTPEYKIEYNEKIIDLMTKGLLDCEIYAALDVSKASYYRWLNEYPDFKSAHEEGLPKCEAWWVTKMKEKWQQGDEKGFKYCKLIVDTKFGYREPQTAVTNNTLNITNNVGSLPQDRQALLEYIKNQIQQEDQLTIDVDFINESPKPAE